MYKYVSIKDTQISGEIKDYYPSKGEWHCKGTVKLHVEYCLRKQSRTSVNLPEHNCRRKHFCLQMKHPNYQHFSNKGNSDQLIKYLKYIIGGI